MSSSTIQTHCPSSEFARIEDQVRALDDVEAVGSLREKDSKKSTTTVFIKFRSEETAKKALPLLAQIPDLVVDSEHQQEGTSAKQADGSKPQGSKSSRKKQKNNTVNLAAEFFQFDSTKDSKKGKQNGGAKRGTDGEAAKENVNAPNKNNNRRGGRGGNRQGGNGQDDNNNNNNGGRGRGGQNRGNRGGRQQYQSQTPQGDVVAQQDPNVNQQGYGNNWGGNRGGRGGNGGNRGRRQGQNNNGRGRSQRLPFIPPTNVNIAIVDNIPFNMTNIQLAEIFCRFGRILDISRLEMMAMVFYDSPEAVQNCIMGMNGQRLKENTISVSSGSMKIPGPIAVQMGAFNTPQPEL